MPKLVITYTLTIEQFAALWSIHNVYGDLFALRIVKQICLGESKYKAFLFRFTSLHLNSILMTVFSGLLFYDFSFLFSNVFTCFHVYDQKPETRAFSIAYIYIFFDFSCSGRAAGFVYIFFCIFLCFVFFFLCVYALSRLRLRFYVSSFPLFPFPANECFALDSP